MWGMCTGLLLVLIPCTWGSNLIIWQPEGPPSHPLRGSSFHHCSYPLTHTSGPVSSFHTWPCFLTPCMILSIRPAPAHVSLPHPWLCPSHNLWPWTLPFTVTYFPSPFLKNCLFQNLAELFPGDGLAALVCCGLPACCKLTN